MSAVMTSHAATQAAGVVGGWNFPVRFPDRHADRSGQWPSRTLTTTPTIAPAEPVNHMDKSTHDAALPASALDQLRPSIAAIVGFAELAALTDLTDEQRQYVEAITAASQQLDRLLTDLAMRSTSATHDYVAPATCTVQSVLEEAIAAGGKHAATHGITIVTDSSDADNEILTDRDGLATVMTNLVANAVAHSKGRQVRVFARRVRGERNVDTYRFAVSDDGGSLDVIQAKQTLSSGPTSAFTSTLSANQIWVRKHGGQIDVAVDPGRSTTFWFDLAVTCVERAA